jgi:hypothetical protein
VANGYNIALKAGVSNWMPYDNPGLFIPTTRSNTLSMWSEQGHIGDDVLLVSWPGPFVKYHGTEGWIQYEVVYLDETTSGTVLVRHPGVAWALAGDLSAVGIAV